MEAPTKIKTREKNSFWFLYFWIYNIWLSHELSSPILLLPSWILHAIRVYRRQYLYLIWVSLLVTAAVEACIDITAQIHTHAYACVCVCQVHRSMCWHIDWQIRVSLDFGFSYRRRRVHTFDDLLHNFVYSLLSVYARTHTRTHLQPQVGSVRLHPIFRLNWTLQVFSPTASLLSFIAFCCWTFGIFELFEIV